MKTTDRPAAPRLRVRTNVRAGYSEFEEIAFVAQRAPSPIVRR